jgi:hypothetical protein
MLIPVILESRHSSGRDVKLTNELSLVQRPRTMELYLHSPIRLHDVLLNYLNLWTTLGQGVV